MKQFLLGTTVLVIGAGTASAEIALTGSAEMGIIGGTGLTDRTTQFWQDIDVTFTFSGETDNGLTFGGAIDLDEDADAVGTDDAGVAIFISGAFGTVTMGDTDGAFDWALRDVGNIGNPGSLNDDETSHFGYNGSYLDGAGDNQVFRYDYSFEQFRTAVSVEQPDDGASDDLTWAIGFGYQFEFAGGAVDLGIGYQDAHVGAAAFDFGASGLSAAANTDVTALGVSISATLDSGFGGGLSYTTYDLQGPEEITHIGIGAGYTFDAISVHANYGIFDSSTPDFRSSGYGLAAGYDLGGGLDILFGYGTSERETPGNDFSASSYSLGLSFSF
jgi:outer membrane protein OmpU